MCYAMRFKGMYSNIQTPQFKIMVAGEKVDTALKYTTH
jgi:hypothetical protein